MKFAKTSILKPGLIVTLLLVAAFGSQAVEVFQPIYTQDFESAPEFGLPTGWTQENSTDPDQGSYINGEIDLTAYNLAEASEFEGWTVVTTDTLAKINGDRLNVPSVVQGKCVYAESDTRSGYQRQYLYAPVWDLRQYQKIQMRFDSNYVQNQDSIGFVEYTLQGNLQNDNTNKKWLPLFYWVNSSEVTDANGDVQTLMESNGLNDNTGEPYINYIGADVAAIQFSQIGGRGDDDKSTNKKHETFDIPTAGGQQYVQVRFFQGGGASWYWGIDNFVIGTLVESEIPKNPNTPTISVNPQPPLVQDKIMLMGSDYVSPGSVAMNKATWQVALDQEFNNIIFSTATSAGQLSVEVPQYRLSLGTPVYARVQYIDKNDASSDFSTPIQFTLTFGPKLTKIFSEDFESIDEGQLPAGWTGVNLSDLSGGPPLVDLTGWTVILWNTFSQLGDADKYTSIRSVVNGEKSCLANSDNYGPYEEGHLFTPKINLTGVKDVYLTFLSNYEQNQDNIGVLEYTIDGGDVDDSRTVKGTFLPIAYLLDAGDIKSDANGNVDAAATFDPTNIADGTSVAYGDLAFAALSMPVTDLAPYISKRIDDDAKDSKRFEKYRLPKADNQANVRIRWTNMGTNSWFWGIDDVQIWGDTGTDVSDWSLF